MKILKIAFVALILCFNAVILLAQTKDNTAQTKKKDGVATIQQSTEKLVTEVKKVPKSVNSQLTDSLPVKNEFRKPNIPVDSLSMSYENGKLNLPKSDVKGLNLEGTKKNLETVELPALDGEQDKLMNSLKEMKEIETPEVSQSAPIQGVMKDKDSIESLVMKHKASLEEALSVIDNPKKILSHKSLKKLYDSLGISKVDSVMALMGNKQEVNTEEMLQALNLSVPGLPETTPISSPEDVPHLNDVKNLQSKVQAPDLNTLKLNQDELMNLGPMRGFQVPKLDSIIQDSIRKANLKLEKLKLKETELTEGIKSSVAKEKQGFWGSTYFDGVVSYLKDGNADRFQIAPALGIKVTNKLSFGLGPTIFLTAQEKKWNTSFGYRTFAKYEFLFQRAYLQVEDAGDIVRVKPENSNKVAHRILMGGGALLPISKKMALNLSLLYQVNQTSIQNNGSPWVVRVGLSTFKSASRK